MGIPFTVWRAALHQKRQHLELGDAVISNEKIKKALGWVPKVGLEYGLKLTYDYYKDKLEEYLK